MGRSYSATNTSINNQPVTLNDAVDGLVLANSTAQVGGTGNINGANYGVVNVTDGGAVKAAMAAVIDGGKLSTGLSAQALNLGGKSIEEIANLTRDFLAGSSRANIDALNFAGRQADSALSAVQSLADKDGAAQNRFKQMAYAVAAVVGLWLLTKGKVF